jgi:arylsulfatase A-like enzyme
MKRALSREGSFPALTIGATFAALVDVIASAIKTPFLDASTQVLHAVFDVALFVSVGLFLDLAIGALVRLSRLVLPRRPAVPFYLAYATLGGLAILAILERVYARQSQALLDGRFATAMYWGFALGAAIALPSLHVVASWLGGRRWLFVLGVLGGLAALIENQLQYRDDYFEGHNVAIWGAATLLGASLATRLSPWLDRRRSRRWALRSLQAAAVVCVVLTVVTPPNRVRLALFRSPGAAAAWVCALTFWQLPHSDVAPDARLDPSWLAARSSEPRAARPLLRGGPPPVVVLVTIDATRADMILDPQRQKRLPTFSRLMREGVSFTEARSAGSQTAVSLTALFSGKYFSGMRWARFGGGKNDYEYAAADTTPRLTSLLREHEIPSFKVVSLAFLKNDFGVAPGFDEEVFASTGRRHATANEVVPPLLDRLREAKDQPLFAFIHMTEPHSPYDRGRVKGGLTKEAYFSEIEVADQYLGKIVHELESEDLSRRSLLIVSSDHGEAFGEHGTTLHTKTIYEELIRVPLVVWGKGVTAQKVDVPVSLLDIGPTVLDAFDIPTPDAWVGESLVPFLKGGTATPTRPLMAEGRLRTALFLGQDKLIVDQRRKVVEVFDLSKDPGELHNLYDEDPARFAPALSALDAFFDAHAFKAPGYSPVYKP